MTTLYHSKLFPGYNRWRRRHVCRLIKSCPNLSEISFMEYLTHQLLKKGIKKRKANEAITSKQKRGGGEFTDDLLTFPYYLKVLLVIVWSVFPNVLLFLHVWLHRHRAFKFSKDITITSIVQKLRWFCCMGGFCRLAELHQEGSVRSLLVF